MAKKEKTEIKLQNLWSVDVAEPDDRNVWKRVVPDDAGQYDNDPSQAGNLIRRINKMIDGQANPAVLVTVGPLLLEEIRSYLRKQVEPEAMSREREADMRRDELRDVHQRLDELLVPRIAPHVDGGEV